MNKPLFAAVLASAVVLGSCNCCCCDESASAVAAEAPAVSPTNTPRPADAPTPAKPSLHALGARTLAGDAADLAAYRGKVLLVVNTASECGYTPQYEGLEQLHEELAPKGFAVLGFPSNDFGGQEPGNAAEIQAFCTERFHVTFPLFEKVVTKAGADQSPVYAYLGEATGKLPNWNFCKYLVGADGVPLAFYSSKTKPDDAELRAAIDAALGAH